MKLLPAVWQGLRGLFVLLAALVVFIEEVGWRPLAAWAARFSTWPPLARLEALIVRASPRVALALFAVPAVLLFPIKIAALALMHAGRPWLGIVVLVAAKLLGTALVGRLFVLLEPQLMKFERFRRAMAWWQATRDRIKAAVFDTAAWRGLRGLFARIRGGWRRLFSR